MSLRRPTVSLSFLILTLAVALTSSGCGGGPGKFVSLTAPTMQTQPANKTVTVGQTATFTVVASGGSLTYQWQMNTQPITGATAASFTTPPTVIGDNGAQFAVVVSNPDGKITSSTATLTVNPASIGSTDVVTYHNDIARTGQNLTETTLTTSNVNSAKFGKIGFYPVDGLVDAEPLYASNISVQTSGSHNLLIVATEHGSVYAFDADTGSKIWQITTLKAGETTSDDRGCSQVTPEIGVTATPVIDPKQGPHGAVYVVAMSKDGSG